jgi:hypothetical protein
LAVDGDGDGAAELVSVLAWIASGEVTANNVQDRPIDPPRRTRPGPARSTPSAPSSLIEPEEILDTLPADDHPR